MPLITAIQLQKNGKFANLFIDGQFRLGIDLLTVTKEKLKVGKEISNQKINMLLVDSIQTKMLNACLNFLSFRPRSEKEMRIYLDKKAKKYTSIINQKPLVEEIINKLKRQDQINDEKFASWWIAQRTKFRPKGSYVISGELKMKGINIDIIKNLLSERDDLQAASDVLKNKQDLISNDRKTRERCVGFLRRRGFSWETIRRLVDEQKAKQ